MPPATITVRVLLFAHLRRQAEASEFMAELPLGATVRDLAERLQHSGLNLRGCAAAVNEMYAALDTCLLYTSPSPRD